MLVERQYQPLKPVGFLCRRIHRDGAIHVIPRLLVLSRVDVGVAETAAHRHRSGIVLLRGVRLEQRLLEPSLRRQHERVPLVRGRIAGIELDGATELPGGTVPVPVVNEETPRERRVRLCERVVQLDGFTRVELRLLEALVHRHVPVVDVERVRVSEPGVRQRIGGVGGDRLLEVLDPLGHVL